MIYKETMGCVTEYFNQSYFELHNFLLSNGDTVASRNGATMELLNFKTIINNPIKRCVGGYKRNINVFFLLAEALWIFTGKREVSFLDTYNSQLKQYSDDGFSYHAPYGWRLRNWGMESLFKSKPFSEDSNRHANQGIDQIREAITMLDKNPEDRRVVMSIWNPEFDLNHISKDIPCNDMVMYKIRNGKLYSTIANRSNDLNLGLTTNVFQFSFINEIIARILNIGLGDQVHNSQSLHLYLAHPMTSELCNNISNNKFECELYNDTKSIQMDFNFTNSQDASDKLRLIDFHINSIIWSLSAVTMGQEPSEAYLESLKDFSRYFYFIYKLLEIYIHYKSNLNHLILNDCRIKAIESISALAVDMPDFQESDYILLAQNFFISKFKGKTQERLSGLMKESIMQNIGKY